MSYEKTTVRRTSRTQYVIPAYLVEFWGEKRIRMMANGFKADMRAAGLPLDRRSFDGFLDYLEGGMDAEMMEQGRWF